MDGGFLLGLGLLVGRELLFFDERLLGLTRLGWFLGPGATERRGRSYADSCRRYDVSFENLGLQSCGFGLDRCSWLLI